MKWLFPVIVLVSACAPAGQLSSTRWVYHNGRFSWPGDWSWAARASYTDTAGVPLSGPRDIAVTLTGPWGGWLPYAPNKSWNLAPYRYLKLAIKPTVAGQVFHIFFEAANDRPIGTWVDPVARGYGPPGAVGQWQVYRIPLTAFDTATSPVAGAAILKFGVQDNSGTANTFYLDDVGFE